MKNKIERLHTHLDNEIRLYKFYFKFLEDLQKEIVSGNTEAIDEMIRNIRFSERDFSILHEERIGVLQDILGKEDNLEFSQLVNHLTDEEYQSVLEKKNTLNGLIEDVRHYNEVNKIILDNALNFTRQRLDHFREPSNDSYGKSGKSKEKKFKNSVNWSV